MRGYIAMLAVREEYRGRGVATKLVRMAVDVMVERDADEVCSYATLSLLKTLVMGLLDCFGDRNH
jgi:ribosomal protein S18 acetylase RimI-like enzyme